MTTDLTTGKVSKVILTFSLPLLLSTVLQQFYNVADSIIVGQFTGAGGLAAIGAAYPITLFFIAIATGASMGCSVIISQIFGAKRLGDMKQAVTTSLVSFIALGIFLMFDPFKGKIAMTIITGAALILSGIANLWLAHELKKTETPAS